MISKYNVSGVALGNTAPASAPAYSNAGLWHNFYCYNTLLNYQKLGTNDPELSVLLQQMSSMESALELNGTLPQGSSVIFNQVIAAIQAGEGISTFDQVIAALQAIDEATYSNSQYTNTALNGLTNIAYCSAVFNSHVTDNGGNFFAIPRWLKIVCGDITGALGGSGFGPIGEIIGAVAGSIGAAGDD